MCGDVTGCHNLEGEVLLASNGQRRQTMMNIPLRTGQSLTTRNDPGQNVVVPRPRNPDPNQGKGGRCPITVIYFSVT